ncbi:MAG: aromatic ring-hydroxylating dioxygenase subunit alpha [Pseudomonadales bacterium]|nr:aromatic ring-hydroxylating dioxygenase subunit alpha [Pseudomonadales bacterium]
MGNRAIELTEIPASYRIPAEAYYDEAWLEKEKRNIFGRSWLYAGLESELPEPGCYKTVSVGLDNLIVVQDGEGELNAFHNICRHRGTRLVSAEGKCASFVCPYHKWGWGLDGRLRGIPKNEQFEDLDPAELGLHKASIVNWMGLLFVHSDETPSLSFEQWSLGLADELSVFKVDELQVLRQESFTFDANWKLYIENHVDWLHLWYVHPKTLGSLTHDHDQVMHFGSSFVSYDRVKPKYAEAAAAANPLPELPHLKAEDQRFSETGAHFLFPNLPIFTGSSFFAITELVPLSPSKTQMNVTLLGLPGGNVDIFMKGFKEITKDEDATIIASIQENVRSTRYKVGPIAHTYEKAISNFHDHYLDLIEG